MPHNYYISPNICYFFVFLFVLSIFIFNSFVLIVRRCAINRIPIHSNAFYRRPNSISGETMSSADESDASASPTYVSAGNMIPFSQATKSSAGTTKCPANGMTVSASSTGMSATVSGMSAGPTNLSSGTMVFTAGETSSFIIPACTPENEQIR